MDHSDKIVAMTLQIYHKTRLHLYIFLYVTAFMIQHKKKYKKQRKISIYTTNRCYRLNVNPFFLSSLVLLPKRFQCFFLLFSSLFYVLVYEPFLFFFNKKKPKRISTESHVVAHKTITIMMMKLMPYDFFLFLFTYWNSSNLAPSSTSNGHKGTSFQGDSSTISSPARRSEVSPIQNHVSTVHICFTSFKWKLSFFYEENYSNLCNESLYFLNVYNMQCL